MRFQSKHILYLALSAGVLFGVIETTSRAAAQYVELGEHDCISVRGGVVQNNCSIGYHIWACYQNSQPMN